MAKVLEVPEQGILLSHSLVPEAADGGTLQELVPGAEVSSVVGFHHAYKVRREVTVDLDKAIGAPPVDSQFGEFGGAE